MAQARVQALKVLMARLVPSDALSRVPQVDPNSLVRDFEVMSEKVGSTRYIGTLSVRFDADKVRALLWSAHIPFSDTQARPVLVLPVFEPGGGPVLFEASNSWLGAWAALPREPRVVPFVVPGGDLDDLKAISAAQALGADAGALGAIAARYGVQEVLIADATPDASGGIAIRLLRVAEDGSGQDSFTVPAQPGEDEAAALARAAEAVATRVQDAWKRGAPQGPEHTLLATLPVQSLGEWIDVRKKVEQLDAVRQVELRALSPRAAKVTLHYSGDLPALQANLAAAGLMLVPAPAGEQGWLLRPRQPGEQPYAAAPYGGNPNGGAPYGGVPSYGAGESDGQPAPQNSAPQSPVPQYQAPMPYAAPTPYSGRMTTP